MYYRQAVVLNLLRFSSALTEIGKWHGKPKQVWHIYALISALQMQDEDLITMGLLSCDV